MGRANGLNQQDRVMWRAITGVIALDTILQRLSSEQEALILKGRIFDLKKRLLLSEDRGCVLGEEGTGVMWVLDL